MVVLELWGGSATTSRQVDWASVDRDGVHDDVKDERDSVGAGVLQVTMIFDSVATVGQDDLIVLFGGVVQSAG